MFDDAFRGRGRFWKSLLARNSMDMPQLTKIPMAPPNENILYWWAGLHIKVSVQGVVAFGGRFATLCQELDFYEVFFFIINFQNEKANTVTLLIILIIRRLQIELHSTNLLLWPPICRNKRAITPKCYNSLETNFTSYASTKLHIPYFLK